MSPAGAEPAARGAGRDGDGLAWCGHPESERCYDAYAGNGYRAYACFADTNGRIALFFVPNDPRADDHGSAGPAGAAGGDGSAGPGTPEVTP